MQDMQGITEYIENYGSLGFDEKPFCEIDALIFSQLSYVDFGGIADGEDGAFLSDAAVKYYSRHSDEENEKLIGINAKALKILTLCAKTNRFGFVRICRYVNYINGEIDKANNYVISSSKDGVSFNLVLAKKRLKQAADGETITIYYEFIQPEICTKALDEKQFRDVLGSYSTYGTGTKGRITNITLAAQSCDGVILMPGDIFSFNDTLGERTEERGYKEATVYINNKSAKGIGGGICQVSSTLFAAVLYADLEIVQRTNHSLTVGYLPLGMDAAVSWGTLDFRFRNNTDYPIRLSVTYEKGNIDVEILGTKETNTTVEITTEELDPLTVKTFRSHYDSAGNLLDTQQVAYSKYQGVH